MYHNSEKDADSSVIHWRPVGQPPEEDFCYILVKSMDEGDLTCSPAIYEDGAFFDHGNTNYRYSREEILGWSYYPYDDHG